MKFLWRIVEAAVIAVGAWMAYEAATYGADMMTMIGQTLENLP